MGMITPPNSGSATPTILETEEFPTGDSFDPKTLEVAIRALKQLEMQTQTSNTKKPQPHKENRSFLDLFTSVYPKKDIPLPVSAKRQRPKRAHSDVHVGIGGDIIDARGSQRGANSPYADLFASMPNDSTPEEEQNAEKPSPEDPAPPLKRTHSQKDMSEVYSTSFLKPSKQEEEEPTLEQTKDTTSEIVVVKNPIYAPQAEEKPTSKQIKDKTSEIVVVKNPIYAPQAEEKPSLKQIKDKTSEIVVVKIPIYAHQEKGIIDKLKKELTYFLDLPNKLMYKEALAVSQLTQCLDFHSDHFQPLVDIVCEIHNKAVHNKYPHRFNRVLMLALCEKVHFSFFWMYAQAIEKYQFGNDMFWEFRKAKKNPLEILSATTQSELENSKSETLFREDCLSSSLCRDFIKSYWNKELSSLLGKMRKKFENKSANLDAESLAMEVLQDICSMKVPKEVTQILTMRRKHILDFIHKHSIEDRSRKYICEILFLRVLCPHIIEVFSSTNECKLALQVVRILQLIANEEEKYNPSHIKDDDPLKKFIDMHQRFVNTHSL